MLRNKVTVYSDVPLNFTTNPENAVSVVLTEPGKVVGHLRFKEGYWKAVDGTLKPLTAVEKMFFQRTPSASRPRLSLKTIMHLCIIWMLGVCIMLKYWIYDRSRNN